MRRLLLLCAGLGVFSGVAQAHQFVVPEEVEHAGKTYGLAYQTGDPESTALYEYTTDDEAVEHWNTLVTLSYQQPDVMMPATWFEMTKAALERRMPTPDYHLYTKGDNGYSITIYEPDALNLRYEAHVQKSFHIKECGGVVSMQFAQRYPPAPDRSEAGKLAYLKQIADDAAKTADELENSDWLPTCE